MGGIDGAWCTVRRGTSYPGNSRPERLESSDPELVSAAERRLPELREMGRLSPEEESEDRLRLGGGATSDEVSVGSPCEVFLTGLRGTS